MVHKSSAVANPRRITTKAANGRKVSLAATPLVAYALNCGHMGRAYAVVKGDHVFCEQCQTNKRIKTILAT